MADPDAPDPRWWVVLVDPRWLVVAHGWCRRRDHALVIASNRNRRNERWTGQCNPNRFRPTLLWVVLSDCEATARWPWLAPSQAGPIS